MYLHISMCRRKFGGGGERSREKYLSDNKWYCKSFHLFGFGIVEEHVNGTW